MAGRSPAEMQKAAHIQAWLNRLMLAGPCRFAWSNRLPTPQCFRGSTQSSMHASSNEKHLADAWLIPSRIMIPSVLVCEGLAAKLCGVDGNDAGIYGQLEVLLRVSGGLLYADWSHCMETRRCLLRLQSLLFSGLYMK